jgi:hypothetical protein
MVLPQVPTTRSLGVKAFILLAFAVSSIVLIQTSRLRAQDSTTPEKPTVALPPAGSLSQESKTKAQAPAAQPAALPAAPATDSTQIPQSKIDRIQETVDKLAKKSDDSSAWTTKDIASVLSAIAALAALFLSYRAVSISRSMTLTQLRQSVRNEKAKALQSKLDTFDGPLVQLRNTSNLL